MTTEHDTSSSLMKIRDIIEQAKHSSPISVYITATIVGVVIKKTKGGKSYFDLTFRDDSGSVNAKKFLRDESMLPAVQRMYAVNTILDVNGTYDKKYKSMTVENETIVGVVEPTTVVETSVVGGERTTTIDIEELTTYLKNVIKTVSDPWMLTLLRSVFNDQQIRDQFFSCPAGVTNHHDYKGGLLHHTVGMLKLLGMIISIHPNSFMNVDLLKTGIIVHDIGKIRVYKFDNGRAEYIHPDQKIDHVKVGDILLDGAMANIKGFPADIKQQIHRILASHHGKLEWGATIEPVYDEETIIHSFDLIDARFGRRGGRHDNTKT